MDEMRQKAIKHYKELAQRQPQYSQARMAELAPGVVAVEDQSGECDALFDTKRWQFTNPQLWARDESPLLKNSGMNVLEGVGKFPPVSTIEEIVGFARSQLSSRGGEAWHDTPQFFTV